MLRLHWQAINAGQYELAHSYLSPRYRRQFAYSDWLASKYRDRPQASAISAATLASTPR